MLTHSSDTKNINWEFVYSSLNQYGYFKLPQFLPREQCSYFINNYNEDKYYRSVIDMKRYRFGFGQYKYFNYPLPQPLQQIREELYPPLANIANQWMKILNVSVSYPREHSKFIEHCHNNEQRRPTPLILKYEKTGHNTLHQDLYGEVYFPFQAVIVLSQNRKDFEGGEFVITERVPRAQSKATVIRLDQGDALIFTTNFRPVKGSKRYYKSVMKHGLSEVTSGSRYALGIIFHDAQ